MKLVDTRTHFVWNYGKIRIVFVQSEENDVDIFMKNTSESMYNKYTQKLMI